MASSASEQLERLEAIFFRIALSEDTEAGLQATIDQFLVKIISFLSPLPGDAVRQKVVEILSHLNKRLNAQTNVTLPLNQLLALLDEPGASLLLLNFAKVYIRMGFKRISREQATQLLPEVLAKGLAPGRDLPLLMFMLGSCLLKIGASDDAYVKNTAELTQEVRDVLLAILLFPYGSSAAEFPCLSAGQVKAVKESGFVDSLENLKMATIQLLACWAKSDAAKAELIAPHYLVACSDSTGRVASYAEAQLRHINNAIDWTGNLKLLLNLIQLYMGSGKATAQQPDPLPPADLRLRLKIMPAIARFSSSVTSQVRSRCVPVVFDSLFSANSNPKLKQLALQFVHSWLDAWLWEQLSPLAPVLSSALVQLLKQPDDDVVKPAAYSAIGKLFSRFPSLVEANLDLVLAMFQQVRTFEEEGQGHPLAQDIEQTLNAVSPAICQHLPIASRDSVITKVTELCGLAKSSKRSARIGLRYLRLLPADHLSSRFLLIQLSAKADPDFKAECLKALFEPYLPKPDQPDSLVSGVSNPLLPGVSYPKMHELLAYFHERFQEGKYNSDYALTYGNNSLPFSAQTCTQLVLYLRTVLAVVECSAPQSDVLIATLQLPELQSSSPFLYRYFAASPNQRSLLFFDLYSSILIDILSCHAETVPLFLLVELVSTFPTSLLRQKVNSLKSMLAVGQQFTTSIGNLDGIELFGQLFGRIQSIVEPQLGVAAADVTKFDRLAVGLLCNCQLVLARLRDEGQCFDLPPQLTPEFFEQQFVGLLRSVVDSSDRLVALKAISQASLFYSLWKSEKLMESVAESWTKAMSAKEARLRPWAIHAYGRFGCSMFSLDEASSAVKQKAIDKLLGITPDEDIYSWIARALVDIILGPLSVSNANVWCASESAEYSDAMEADGLLKAKLPSGVDYAKVVELCSRDVDKVIERLLTVQLRNSSKFFRECGLVCLFVVLRCAFGRMPDVVRAHFPAVNQSLFLLLSEDNAHIQQTLSELMAFMYDATPEEEREKQLEPLIDVLMGRKKIGVSVASGGQTEVFKEGSFGELPEGQKLSTYKELCSLASDLNQPDLIYRFMELANDRCSWLTKSCAAAGLGSIFAKRSGSSGKGSQPSADPTSKLTGSLLAGIGKLYRYQFDPDASVRQTMASLWQLVLSSSSGNARDLVNTNLDPIFSDIDKSLPSRLWRVRESALGALGDSVRLLVDPHDKRLLSRLPSFWNAVLHLCDDIKESVRVAATKTARSLQKVTLRVAQSKKSGETISQASTCLGEVIEVIFKIGVESKADEVRAVSLATLMQLIDSAGHDLLAPHSTALIVALLEASATLEPQMLSYISVRAQDEAELAALETVRVRVAGFSPTAQAVEQCIDIVPLEAFPTLFLRLADLLKPTSGLLTRTATCQAVTQLVLRRFRGGKTPLSVDGIDQPLTRLFNALLSGSADRSEPMRKAAASTLAQLACLRPDPFVQRTAQKACDWYLKGSLQLEDDSDPLLAKAASSLLQSLTRHCPIELLQTETSQAALVPCLFFALHEKHVTQDEVTSSFKRVTSPPADVWDDVWSEVSQGTESTLRRHLDGICELLGKCSQVQRYGLRLQTAVAVEALVDKADRHLSSANVTALARCLMSLLQGRTWPGKDVIVEVVMRYVDKVGSTFDDECFNAVVAGLVRESRKSQLTYAVIGFKALCRVVDLRPSITTAVTEVASNFDDFLARCHSSLKSSPEDSEDEPASATWPKKLAVAAEFIETTNACTTLSSEHLTTVNEQAMSNIVELFTCAMLRTTTSNSTKQLAARLLAAFERLFAKVFKSPSVSSVAGDFRQAVLECAKLSSKLKGARSVALVNSLLACLRHFYETRPGLAQETLVDSGEWVEIREQIAELCEFARKKALNDNEHALYFESALKSVD